MKTIVVYHNAPNAVDGIVEIDPNSSSEMKIFEFQGQNHPEGKDRELFDFQAVWDLISDQKEYEGITFIPSAQEDELAEIGLTHLIAEYIGPVEVLWSDKRDTSELAIVVEIPSDLTIRGPNTSADFFDMMREFDTILRQISDHIRGINDPDVVDVRLAMVRASAEAVRCYIDINNEKGPDRVPVSAVKELDKNLKKIDWSKLSSELRGWIKTAQDIIGLCLKSGSS